MANENSCPICGKPVEVNALHGLCPECMLKGAFPTGDQSDADDPSKPKASSFVPPTPEELAVKFPQLEIIELLGRGGMGAVYKARQKRLDRIVALKILPPDIGNQASFAERFTREAKALAKLNHPNIVTLYEFGETSGLFFFLMEFVDGVNLRQLLDTGRVASREALAIVPQICDALQFAHDHGIVHRDIKPENILMDRRGKVKVADFGLAKLVRMEGRARHSVRAEHAQNEDGVTRPTSELTEAGKVMGTPQYMAPEQKDRPLEVDHRADIYALGVVFYQMLTGELPGKQIEAPSTKVHIDVRLDEIVLRALESKPELRYQQASVLKTQVETVVATSGGAGGKPVLAHSHPHGQTPSFGDPVSRVLVVTASILIAAVWGYFSDLRQGEVIWFLGRLITVPAIALGLHLLIVRYVWRAPTQPTVDPNSGGSRREMSSGLVSSALAREDRGGRKWASLAGLVLILGTVVVAYLFLEKSFRRVSPETVIRVEEKLRNEIENRLHEAGWTVHGLVVNVSPNLARAKCEFEFASLDSDTPHPLGGVRPAEVFGTKLKTTGENDLMERVRKKFPASIQIRRQDQEHWTVEGSGEFAFLRFSIYTREERFAKAENLGAASQMSSSGAGINTYPTALNNRISPVTDGNSFGPVIERVVNEIASRHGQEGLQLSSGMLFSRPQSEYEWAGIVAWMNRVGADLVPDLRANHRLMLGTNIVKLADFPAEDWEAATVKDVVAHLKSGLDRISYHTESDARHYWLTEEPMWPIMLAVQTAQGQVGLLQISSFTKGLRQTKIRYKLVKKAVIEDSRSSPPVKTQIDFKLLRAEVPKGSRRILLHFERDKNYGLGFELSQTLIPGPNSEGPALEFLMTDGNQRRWVGVGDNNVLEWRLPPEFTESEIKAAVKEIERKTRKWQELSEGANLEVAHLKHRDGWIYILLAHVRHEPGSPRRPAPPGTLFTSEQRVIVPRNSPLLMRIYQSDGYGGKTQAAKDLLFQTAPDRDLGFVIRFHAYLPDRWILDLVDSDKNTIFHREEGGFAFNAKMYSPNKRPLPGINEPILLDKTGAQTRIHFMHAKQTGIAATAIPNTADIHAEFEIMKPGFHPAFRIAALAPGEKGYMPVQPPE
ncbi:MAG: serine/threonine protein kinase [Verrucomicrobia bacterium]|nr:serine/threonine protein kinase [Verrucomicrobiota bacterium]